MFYLLQLNITIKDTHGKDSVFLLIRDRVY